MRFRPHVWMPVLQIHLRTSCQEAIHEYEAKREWPKDYQEFQTAAFKYFDNRVKSTEQMVSDGDDRENLRDSVGYLMKGLQSGNRPELQNMIKSFYGELSKKQPSAAALQV